MERDVILAIKINKEGALCAYHSGGQYGLLDRTGGYGRLIMPMAIGRSEGVGPWLIGEDAYALGAEGATASEEFCLDLLKGPLAINLMAAYIETALSYVYEMNPKAEVEEVRLMVPGTWTAAQKEDLKEALSKKVASPIRYIEAVQAIEAYIAHHQEAALGLEGWLEVDGVSLRRWRWQEGSAPEFVLEVKEGGHYQHHERLYEAIKAAYEAGTGRKAEGLETVMTLEQMAGHYMPLFYQRLAAGKAMKVTFNDVFPPFQTTLSHEKLEGMAKATIAPTIEAVNRASEGGRVMVSGSGARLPWLHPHLKDALVVWDGMMQGAVIPGLKDIEVPLLKGALGIFLKDGAEGHFHELLPAGSPCMGNLPLTELFMAPEETVIALYEKGTAGYREVCQVPLKDRPPGPVTCRLKGHFNHEGRPLMTTTFLPI